MNEWRTADCGIDGVKIHFTRTGSGKSPLILLHGLTANGLCWSSVARELSDMYEVIMPDLRGHGKSSAPDYGYGYDDHANDVIGLIKVLGLSNPVLIGHSMGGLIAAVVASRYPALIRALVLADPTFLSSKQQCEIRDSDVADQHRQLLNKSVDDVVKDIQARHPNRPLATVALIAQARLQTSMNAFDVLTPPYPDYRQIVNSNLACDW